MRGPSPISSFTSTPVHRLTSSEIVPKQFFERVVTACVTVLYSCSTIWNFQVGPPSSSPPRAAAPAGVVLLCFCENLSVAIAIKAPYPLLVQPWFSPASLDRYTIPFHSPIYSIMHSLTHRYLSFIANRLILLTLTLLIHLRSDWHTSSSLYWLEFCLWCPSPKSYSQLEAAWPFLVQAIWSSI